MPLPEEGGMPIRFWYLPFALFSGECNLVPSELGMQVDEDTANFDEVGPEKVHIFEEEKLELRS
jgi:hypothetical protein